MTATAHVRAIHADDQDVATSETVLVESAEDGHAADLYIIKHPFLLV